MALITSIEELKKHLRIPTTNLSSKMPSIEAAEIAFLVPILGQELYTVLVTAYAAGTLTPEQLPLVDRCRAVIAPMAYLRDLPFLQANLSDQGVKVLESDNSRKAYRWEFEGIKEGLASNGYAAMEALIIYMKEHRSDFPEWGTAPYNDPDRSFIIKDGSDLGSAISIQQPHRCFLLLQGMLPMLCHLLIRPVISNQFFDHFNARIVADALTENEKKLKQMLQFAVSRYLMAQAAIELSIRFDAAGFTIVNNTRERPDDGRGDPSDVRLEKFRQEMERTAAAFLAMAKEFLLKNAHDPAFLLFKTSEAFPELGVRIQTSDNSRRRGIFIA